MRALLVLVAFAASLVACGRKEPPPKQYELQGQILAINPEQKQVLVKHGDIKGFMPGMTMPYSIKDDRLLQGKEAGDLISATLVVGETSAYLSTITKTGHAAIE